jgi:hypothetical protein
MTMREFFDKNGKVSRVWNSIWVGVPLWMAAACLTASWYFNLPTPGKAIGALAVVAGIMSVREMKVFGKMAWVALLICMLLTEFRAIDKDHAENDQKQRDFFAAQKAGFGEVVDQAKANFNETAKGIDISISQLTELLVSTQKVVQNITGGDDFGYIFPGPNSAYGTAFSIRLYNDGNEQLTGVTVRISTVLSRCPWPPKPTEVCMEDHDAGSLNPISMGTLGPHTSMLVPKTIQPNVNRKGDGIDEYFIQIAAQNGIATELLWFRPAKVKDYWAYKYLVFRDVHGKPRKGDFQAGGKFYHPLKELDWTEPPPLQK